MAERPAPAACIDEEWCIMLVRASVGAPHSGASEVPGTVAGRCKVALHRHGTAIAPA
jgi:hypothetical protein